MSRCSSRPAAAGPPVTNADGTAPLRQPVSTTQCPAAPASASSVKWGAPFSPAI